jgi:hypothetical protein
MTRGPSGQAISLGAVLALLAWMTTPALAAPAASAGPAKWAITSAAGPAHFKPGDKGDLYIVTATNVGGEATSGPITITDSLSGKAEATEINGSPGSEGEHRFGDAFSHTPLSCEPTAPSSNTCSYAGKVDPGDALAFVIKLAVSASAKDGESIVNSATVSGGAPEAASTSEPTTKPTPVSSESVSFGLTGLLSATSTAQAGAHPNFTTSFSTNWSEIEHALPVTPADARDIRVALPPGVSGDPLSVPRCDIFRVRRYECPEDTAVGVALTRIRGGNWFTDLVYNIVPYPDEPAALAFAPIRGVASARLDTSVVPGANGEYVVRASVSEINQSAPLLSSSVTLWGDPAVHNGPGEDRTSECVPTCRTFGEPGDLAAEAKAFMRNPTSCAGPLALGLEADSWPEPDAVLLNSSPFPTPEKCDRPFSELFAPSLQVTPDTTQAGAPSGYQVVGEVHQSESPESLATPDLKDATVTLPEGTVASPSAANGLEACSDAQFDRASVEPAECPLASEVGKVKIKTPLLEEELTGKLFLGQPECSPCEAANGRPAAEGKLLRLFLQAELLEPGTLPRESAARIKLAGRTHVNEQTGRLETVFENNPQQPFEKLTIHTDGGAGAPVANPSTCGPATTTSRLVPWSSTVAEPFAAEPSSSFEVTGCGAPQFTPAFNAGTTGSPQAGAYSPLSVTFSRTDRDQIFTGITVHTPPGLLGAVSHVTQCGEPEASLATCGPESQIGTVAASAGPGPTPFWITNGRAYLTGPYHGAPFGLSLVVPTKAGPFDLGDEHMRARIFVDPSTSAITVVSDPLPTQKEGVPFQVKTVSVNVNRPQFTFNATNCKQMAIGATISGMQGAAANASSPYQAHGCASLPFHPEFTAEAGGHGSKVGGTSLIVKVKAKAGDANIAKTFLQLPIALPSRLDTIQKACLAATFEANPASCPEGSNIGMAIAHTPLLNSALVGPAYLVSHGNAAFPDVQFVLQGEGVTLILDGKTDIKGGITYSRFETVPDAPVSTFEAVLPAGPHSALTLFVPGADQYNGCSTQLLMPTEITGQNGAVIKQTTHIKVTGCAPSGPTVKLARAKVKGNALLVTVSTSAAGKVKVSGRGLRTTTKSVAAGTHQIRVPLTKAGRQMRKHHRKTTVHVSLLVGKQAVAKATSVRL